MSGFLIRRPRAGGDPEQGRRKAGLTEGFLTAYWKRHSQAIAPLKDGCGLSGEGGLFHGSRTSVPWIPANNLRE